MFKFLMSVLLIFSVFQIGCLEKRTMKVLASEDTTGSWFQGVSSVLNKGGVPSSIEISWSRADRTVVGYNVYVLVEDPVTRVTGWELLDTLSSEQFKFLHSNLESGKIYTYKVQAISLDGLEDGNSALKSTVAFEGIASVTIEGKSTARAELNSGSGAFDEVRVYAIPKSNLASRYLVGVGKGDVSSIPLTGLDSGTTYRFVAAAYMKNINAEDGNNYYVEGQMHSDSFGSGVLADDNFDYRGFLNVQSFGLAPNAAQNPTVLEDPNFSVNFPTMLANPRGRLVRLTWLPFRNSTSSTKYKLVRSSWTNTIDMSTTTPCDVNIDSSCVVCTVTGSGPQRCEDDKVQAPPKAYKYAVSLVKADPATGREWSENLPTVNGNMYVTKVHIAPSYMVQVHRDTANYEMCQLMGKVSNPRRWQRCSYQGFGDRPYASGPGKLPLNLEAGFYDQGYNFFIDRTRNACNWTRTSGACGSPNGCVGISWNGSNNMAPSDAIGNNGDVFWAITTGGNNAGKNCYIKKAGTWRAMDDTANLTQADRAAMTTLDPGPDGAKWNPVAYGLNATATNLHCTAKLTEYGSKRMVRRREWITATAQPTMVGEPNFVNLVYDAARIRTRGSLLSEKRYECDVGPRRSAPNYLEPAPATINDLLQPSNQRAATAALESANVIPSRYFMGTQSTIRCQSRWGTQGLVGGGWEGIFFSDISVRTNPTGQLPQKTRGDVSDFDAGNRDFYGFEWGTGTGPSWGATNGYFNPLQYGSTNGLGTTASVWGPSFILPLGQVTANGVFPGGQDLFDVFNLIQSGILGNGGYQEAYGAYQDSGTMRFSMREHQGRFGNLALWPDWSTWNASLVCAVEAE